MSLNKKRKDKSGIKNLGEFGLIRRLTAGIPRRKGDLRLGIGDDCAILEPKGARHLLVTTDMLIESVHFRRDWYTDRQIGQKAMRVNLSDIAAMGGIPRYAVVAVGLPRSLKLKAIEELFRGIKEVARESGCLLIGGDTNASRQLTLSVTLLGEVEKGRSLTRAGARVGDFIYVTGQLGKAALSLQAHRYYNPPNRLKVGRFLVKRRLATAAIDISDGLLGDLQHIMEESRVGAIVAANNLPGSAPQTMKLTGGEDYEILFTSPPGKVVPREISGVKVSRIGRITPFKEGLRLLDGRGRQFPLPRQLGYRHF